jgi:hypothetical protein
MPQDLPLQFSLRTGILTMFGAAVVIAANTFWFSAAVFVLDVLVLDAIVILLLLLMRGRNRDSIVLPLTVALLSGIAGVATVATSFGIFCWVIGKLTSR